ncbi:MAG: hypothetical protein OEY44_01070 [Candidatus Peregrinibacteria bacterium]|nr:hypothetical protein [Candidatus Peregrinibacteria bacterium]
MTPQTTPLEDAERTDLTGMTPEEIHAADAAFAEAHLTEKDRQAIPGLKLSEVLASALEGADKLNSERGKPLTFSDADIEHAVSALGESREAIRGVFSGAGNA